MSEQWGFKPISEARLELEAAALPTDTRLDTLLLLPCLLGLLLGAAAGIAVWRAKH